MGGRKLAEQESSFVFFGDADRFYQGISSPDEVVGLWEVLADILFNGEVDEEKVFDLLLDDDRTKVIYGPPFTVVFNHRLDGTVEIYTIRRSGP